MRAVSPSIVVGLGMAVVLAAHPTLAESAADEAAILSLLRAATEVSRDLAGTPQRNRNPDIPVANVPPTTEDPFKESVQRAALRYRIPQPLIAAVIKCESNWNPTAESRKGARGLMQVMPRTAADALGIDAARLWDPATNIEAGTRYLSSLAKRYRGDAGAVIAAYNAGPARLERTRARPRETIRFERCVRRWYEIYRPLYD